MTDASKDYERFGRGVEAWKAGLGQVRDVVRQELVRRQLAAHIPDSADQFWVLDAGCGQGTQAISLARLGHNVVGVDVSDDLLDTARSAAAQEPGAVQHRLNFMHADLLDLGDRHAGRYDLVCCHGVAMYLPSLEAAIQAVVAAARPGGLVSVLTRNRAGIAMRAGMTGDWTRALEAFDARYYDNRLGIEAVRADDPAEVRAALAAVGADTVGWYGVRLFTDHWGPTEPAGDFGHLLAAEEEAGRRDPYRSLAAMTHTIASVSST